MRELNDGDNIMRMRNIAAVGLAVVAISGTGMLAADAAIYKGTYLGNTTTDPEVFEPVKVVVKHLAGRKGVWVTRFQVDQGEECGVTNYTHATAPQVMPVKVKTVDGKKKFTITDDESVPGVVVFKVTGTWQTNDVITGRYTQIACDGMPDKWVVYGESAG